MIPGPVRFGRTVVSRKTDIHRRLQVKPGAVGPPLTCSTLGVAMKVLSSFCVYSRVRATSSRLSFLLLTIPFLLIATSVLAQQSLQVLHRHVRPAVSNGQAALVGSLPPAQRMNVSILLPLRNQAELTGLLGRLYDPSSPDYRHFLSVSEFTERFGPTVEDYQAVVEFAQANGFAVTDMPANRMLVPIEGSVAQIEKAFHLSMKVYRHPTENRTFYSPDREPALQLSVPVSHIAGMDNFSIPRPPSGQARARETIPTYSGSGPAPDYYYLGSDMRAAYYGGTALTGAGQAVGVFEFGGYNPSDVDLYFSTTGQFDSVPINNVLLDGMSLTPASTTSGVDWANEAVLDITQVIGMAPGLSQVRVYIGSLDVDIFNKMASENIAKQLGISMVEEDNASNDDSIFEEFAAQGQSVFAASGDLGAYPSPFEPAYFPAEDAYVTAVGGTDLTTNGAGGSWASETAWYASGGGVSPDGIAIPSWQNGVANSANDASTTLRNVPDVAMDGNPDSYVVVFGLANGTGGTSASTQRWAAFMALVNQQAVAAGKPPIGFINPALYTIGEGSNYNSDFHDVTSGTNNCCTANEGFNAVTGYDLVTGWGSPTGQSLINALAGPPATGFTLSNSTQTTGLAINLGGSGSTTITVNDQGGFTGSVSLAVSGLPSGVTASFSPSSTTGTSVLTLTASSSAATGTTYVTVTGTSGDVTASITIPMTVFAPGFALSAPPQLLISYVGLSGITAVTVNDQGGFTGNVSLAVSGLPSGVTALFSPNTTSTTSTLTLTSTSSAAPGMYQLTVTGTSGSLTASVAVYLNVLAPGFNLSDSPGSITLSPGASGGSTITVGPYSGFSGSVALSISGLPTGVTASFNPNPTTNTSSLTLITSSTTPNATYNLTITGTSGTLNSTTSLALTVVTPGGFVLSSSSTSLTTYPGAPAATSITVNGASGFSGSVTLAATGVPSGMTASFNPNPTTGTSVLTATDSSAIPGTYSLTITGSSGSLTASTNVSVTVLTPSISLSISPTTLAIAQGASGSASVTMTFADGSPGSVPLTIPGLPSGVTASFNPNPITGSSVLTLTASPTATTGTATLIINATTSYETATTTLALTVTPGKAAQSIAFAPLPPLNYGAIPFTLTATASSGLPVSYTVTGPATVMVSSLTVTGAGLVTVTANQPGNSVYAAATPVSQSFTVYKASLAVMANNASIVYGQAIPSFTYKILGFLNGDTSSVVSGTATETTTATSASSPGTYPISFSSEGLTALNYVFAYFNGTLTITPATIGQTAPPLIYPQAGTYTSPQTLVLSDTTPGAAIYYTTNGTMPSSTSTFYVGPIALSATETVNAIAIANRASSTVSSAAYSIDLSTSEVNFGTGSFTASELTLDGATVPGGLLQLTDGKPNEARSAWFPNKVPVGGFTTDFTFQQLDATADGFTFAIQNDGVSAIGIGGGGLGYQGIRKSVAIKFDLHNNAGEGADSTGLYIDGAPPTIPATNLISSGINLHSGDVMHAHLAYDGSTLTLTLTDTITGATVTESYAVNIPAILGGRTAYIGFTGGTGEYSAIQNILSWSYSSNNLTPNSAVAPAILPLSGTYTSAVNVTMEDATVGAKIYYTTDGTKPRSSSTLYSGPITVTPDAIINAIAIASGYENSPITTASYFTSTTAELNYAAGAFTAEGLTFNNGADVSGNLLQITDGGTGESRSAWYSTKVPVSSFTTDFTFQQLNAEADGFTFTIQNDGVNAVGDGGEGLGYQSIGKSVAIKFDLYNNAGEGMNSTGMYVNGAVPTVPAIDLTPSGIDLHSGDIMHAHLIYDGSALAMTLTDPHTNAMVTLTFRVDIPAIVGAGSAYVGFTGSAGGFSATQNVLSWSYSH